ncbi:MULTISPECIES: molecular chaperone [Klebsiella]|uniref:fimbrial biogenesis chaperone n=1 Tax=Klebsiella TaxID=570 RepID=UPI002030AA53|nr:MULTISPECIES: fimbria/pilus periplasmic chaperone [Klebsiella]MCM0764455.1 fimbria/pilus periplasmic chaperone [Klebsiella pneumoniae]MCM0770006.1 fimbria/pilus periplasmic chaperone [Klebsiella pneumoniae]MCM0777127.1 fimbria/pilus periplasmic chaperone [Klebsiella pneumoniae]MCM0801082.1 fimbria/pilus periplasmic chaperone [Klebsiella pneumoniae]MCM0899924.1 fimbria/pilus periplasmic chaperone [Klebsiella pneumoniae]
MLYRLLNNKALMFCFLFLSSMSYAGGIRISPVSINISSQDKASIVTLFNMSDESSSVQVRVYKWTQSGGNDNLTEADDVIASPPFITLSPGGSFNFRLVRTNDDKIIGEQSYRIIIDELPKPQDKRSTGSGVGILIRNSLPLFIVNDDAVPELQPSISDSGLLMTNNGNRHALLSDVVVTDLSTDKKISLNINTVNGYVLRNSYKIFPLNGNFYMAGHKYQVTYKMNRLPEKNIMW